MKKYIIGALSVCVFMLILAAYPHDSKGIGDNNTEVAECYYPEVVVPQIPDKLDFSGEQVPLDYFDVRESLQRELMVTLNMHSATMRTLLNTRRYFAIIEPILEANNIPEDFKYLCMAESGLNPEVISSAGAGGLWQIMKGTGKDYGLEVGSEVDERFHIEKSTQVACKYLQEAYDQFGSWTLAAASYNAGRAGISRRVEKQGTSSYYDTYMPQETLRYIYRILSFKLITATPQVYGYMIKEEDYYVPMTNWFEDEVADLKIDWSKYATGHGTNYKMLRQLNPWIRDYDFNNRNGKKWKVKIPGKDFRDGSLVEAAK